MFWLKKSFSRDCEIIYWILQNQQITVHMISHQYKKYCLLKILNNLRLTYDLIWRVVSLIVTLTTCHMAPSWHFSAVDKLFKLFIHWIIPSTSILIFINCAVCNALWKSLAYHSISHDRNRIVLFRSIKNHEAGDQQCESHLRNRLGFSSIVPGITAITNLIIGCWVNLSLLDIPASIFSYQLSSTYIVCAS